MNNPSMVEKVARALCMEAGKHPDRDSRDTDGYPNWIFYKSAARAAIAALREPTETVLETLRDNNLVGLAERWKGAEIWRAMIDCALTEDKQGE